jgi:hypothetical protein
LILLLYSIIAETVIVLQFNFYKGECKLLKGIAHTLICGSATSEANAAAMGARFKKEFSNL